MENNEGLKDIPIDKLYVKCDRCGTETTAKNTWEPGAKCKCGMRFDEMSSW